MVRRIFLDVETLPPDRGDRIVHAHAAQSADEEFLKLALNAEHGRLLCIGLIVEQDGEIKHRGILGRSRVNNQFHLDEARTLRGFWKLLRDFDQRRDILVGFNLLDFDLHFISTRSVINRVKPSINICFARFRSQPVYDVMWEFTHWRYRIKLDDVAKVLGLESSKQDGIDGSTIYDLFFSGRYQEIADYCMRDVELTRAIYYRMNFIDEHESTQGL
jgi:hypothetical protein